jgi:hypothetical protein
MERGSLTSPPRAASSTMPRVLHEAYAGLELPSRGLPRSRRRGPQRVIGNRAGAVLADPRGRRAIRSPRIPAASRQPLGPAARALGSSMSPRRPLMPSEAPPEIYRRDDVDVDARRIDAFARYSDRC